jgi:hypothetical protein
LIQGRSDRKFFEEGAIAGQELEGAVGRGEEGLLEGFVTECVSEYTEL